VFRHRDSGLQVAAQGEKAHHAEEEGAAHLLQPLPMHGAGRDSLAKAKRQYTKRLAEYIQGLCQHKTIMVTALPSKLKKTWR